MDGMKDTNIDGWMNVDTSGECMNIRWMENKWIKGLKIMLTNVIIPLDVLTVSMLVTVH